MNYSFNSVNMALSIIEIKNISNKNSDEPSLFNQHYMYVLCFQEAIQCDVNGSWNPGNFVQLS